MTSDGGTQVKDQLSAAERVARNRAIAEARAAGATWAEIAQRFGLSDRQARRAEKQHLATLGEVATFDEDPGEVLREAIGIHRWALDELRRAATSADNSSAQVGAIRSRVATSKDLVDLLARAGVIPDTPDRWRVERDLHQIARAMLDAIERFERRAASVSLRDEAGDEMWDAAVEVRRVFESLIGLEPPDAPAVPEAAGAAA